MSRKTDLEDNIRGSYNLIHEYEETLRLSADPKERARIQRTLAEQWEYIRDWLLQLGQLVNRLPSDIAEIAASCGALPSIQEPAPAVGVESEQGPVPASPSPRNDAPKQIFLCYRRHVEPDQRLAGYLCEYLSQRGHHVFIDQTIRAGVDWLAELDRQIKASDFLVVLLSKASADSEMVQSEVRRAYEYRRLQGRPHTLPVRIAFEGLLPYSIDAFIDPLQYVVCQCDADDERVAQEIIAAIEGQLPNRQPFKIERPAEGETLISEDGRIVGDEASTHPPLPQFDPRFLQELVAPGGTVRQNDRFYIERDADVRLRHEIVKHGTTTTIRAPRQTGKSSLLVRGMRYAQRQGAQVVHVDVQRMDEDLLETPDLFLRHLARLVVKDLGLDMAEVDKIWESSTGPQDKLTTLLEEQILPRRDRPIVLAMDEVDRLLYTDFHSSFFALVRSWFNSAAYDLRWEMLNIVMVISTEPHLLIGDINQSPFNVGLKLYLEDFTPAQASELNQRHGSPISEGEFAGFMELLHGHPYLSRKALYTMLTENLAWKELARIAASDQGPFSDHLRRYHWLLSNETDLKEALKQVIHHQQCKNELAFFRLLRAGLVKGSGDVCQCRCGLYRVYFEEKIG